MTPLCVDAGTQLILCYSPAEYQTDSSGSVGAIFVAHDIVLPQRCGHVDGCIYFPSANSRQLTCVCVSICVCVCIALWMQTNKGRQLCRPWCTCIWPKLEPAWCEMWFIYTMLRPMHRRQRYLLSCPQHCIIKWPPALPTALWLWY